MYELWMSCDQQRSMGGSCRTIGTSRKQVMKPRVCNNDSYEVNFPASPEDERRNGVWVNSACHGRYASPLSGHPMTRSSQMRHSIIIFHSERDPLPSINRKSL